MRPPAASASGSAGSADSDPASPAADPAGFLRHLYDVAVARALPDRILAGHLPPPPRGRTLVLGAGKAGGSMAAALEAAWPADAPISGLVVTRYAHTPPAWRRFAAPRIELVEAAHPVPDAAGLTAARRMLALTQGLTQDDLVLCLMSGGGSALLSCPADGLTLADKQAINQALLGSGANIGEMNCVRKHLSAIKGGRLAARCAPAKVVSLLISDVPGDDPAVIASGPTVPDPGTCAQALAVLDRYRIALPDGIRARLESGELETPKPGDPAFARSSTRMIATPQQSLEAAAQAARAAGVTPYILADDMQGEARDIGCAHAALARQVARRGQPFARPAVILSGGETTVTVRARGGRGGRAVEFLLGMALELDGLAGVHALAADTDGIDGTEEHAGALIGPDTLARARSGGVSGRDCLDRNDAYTFFAAADALVVPGPTFTNVNDFRAILVT
jgi:glycerate 2-kinase